MVLSALLLLSTLPVHTELTCGASPKIGTKVTNFSAFIRTMIQDRNGDYWFCNDSDGVTRYDGKTLTRYTTSDGLVGNGVVGAHEDNKGNLLFVTINGVSKFDGKKFTRLKPLIMEKPNQGWRLHPDDVWMPMIVKEGVMRWDGTNLYSLKFPKHHLEDAKLALKPATSMYAVYTIYKDTKGFIWFGTADAGLCRYDGKSINWLYEDHLTNTPGGGSFGIRSIIEDRDGRLWVCNTTSKFKVAPQNRATHGLLEYSTENGIGSLKSMIGDDVLYYQSIVKGKEGDLWMMPWGGGVFRFNGKHLTHYPVIDGDKEVLMNQMYKDRKGNLWICTQTSGPYKFNGKAFEKFMPELK